MSVRRLHHEQPASFAFTPANAAWARAQVAEFMNGRGGAMPVLVRLRYCLIAMYFEDHNPPHFHIRAHDGREAEVRLGSLEILKGDVDRRALDEARERANAGLLEETWNDFYKG